MITEASSAGQAPSTLPEKSQIPTVFTPFSNLPLELQLPIWNYAVDEIGPRTVSLLGKAKHNQIPGLFHTCQTARSEARKKYKRFISQRTPTSPSYTIFINYDIDTIYLNHSNAFTTILSQLQTPQRKIFDHSRLNATFLHPTKRLLLSLKTYQESKKGWTEQGNLFTLLLKYCPNLEELGFILNPTEDGDPNQLVEYVHDEKHPGLDAFAIYILKESILWELSIAHVMGSWRSLKLEFWRNQTPTEEIWYDTRHGRRYQSLPTRSPNWRAFAENMIR